jgi:hypothetical protein
MRRWLRGWRRRRSIILVLVPVFAAVAPAAMRVGGNDPFLVAAVHPILAYAIAVAPAALIVLRVVAIALETGRCGAAPGIAIMAVMVAIGAAAAVMAIGMPVTAVAVAVVADVAAVCAAIAAIAVPPIAAVTTAAVAIAAIVTAAATVVAAIAAIVMKLDFRDGIERIKQDRSRSRDAGPGAGRRER